MSGKSALQFDLSNIEDVALLTALDELARKRWQLEAMKAQARQNKLAASGLLETRATDGVGELTRRIDAFAYQDWALKLGSHDCWNDKGFNKYIDRIAPETKVKCHGTRLQVGFERPSDWFERKEPIFKKSYPDEKHSTFNIQRSTSKFNVECSMLSVSPSSS